MNRIALLLGIVFALATGLTLAGPPPVTTVDFDPAVQVFATTPPRTMPLPDAMRQAWTDHCVWSRMVTMGMFTESKGCEFYEERLMANVQALRALLVPYYGDGGEKLAELYEQHIAIGGQVLYALKSDEQTYRAILMEWYRNADQIAECLHQLNPSHWPLDEMELMWRMHLDMVLNQALTFSKEEWAYDVQAYDAMQAHCLRMADFLTRGIMKQFPTR